MKTPVDIIASVDRDCENDAEYCVGSPLALGIIAALDRAGYVILPKEPTEAMTDHEDYVSGNWSRHNWEAVLRSAGIA